MSRTNQISRYLSGEMKGEELENFTKELYSSDTLKTQLFSYKAAKKQYAESPINRNQLKKGAKINYKWLSLAAAIFIGIGLFLFPPFSQTQQAKLAQYNAVNIPLSSNQNSIEKKGKKGSINPIGIISSTVKAKYGKGDYIGVINDLNRLMQEDIEPTTQSLYKLYIGSSYFYLGAYDKAINYLIEFSSSGFDPILIRGSENHRDYTLSLCWLANDKKTEAITLLKQLTSNANENYKDAASALLLKLDQ